MADLSGAPARGAACTTGGQPGPRFAVSARPLDDSWSARARCAGREMYGAEFPRDATVLLIEPAAWRGAWGRANEVTAAVVRAAVRIEQLLTQRGACP